MKQSFLDFDVVNNPVLFKEFAIHYEAPYDWLWMLRLLALHVAEGVEYIDSKCYVRTMSCKNGFGFVGVFQPPEFSDNILIVRISKSLESDTDEIIKRIKILFDTDLQPQLLLSYLGELARENPGLRVPGSFDNFETSVRVILGQLVSVQSANVLMRRYISSYGKKFDSPFANLNQVTPTAAEMSIVNPAQLAGSIGVPLKRAQAIVNLAIALTEGKVIFDKSNPENTIQSLESIAGIGPWTAQTIAMRVLNWSDAFPYGDLGVQKALNSKQKKDLLRLAENWRPWRAYATMHLWNSINAIPDKVPLARTEGALHSILDSWCHHDDEKYQQKKQ